MNADEYLSQIKICDERINNKILEKEQWQALATKITCPTDSEKVQSSGNPDKIYDAVIKMVEIEQEIDRMIDQYVDLKHDVIQVIDKILIVDQYAVIHKKYIQFMTLSEIAEDMNYSYTWICELKNRGLQDVQRTLDS